MSLYPVLTKPSRITSHSPTLIDNIFTNHLENNMVSGLLMNDISDHLPVCVIYECDCRRNKDINMTIYQRVRTEDTIKALRSELISQDWTSVYEAEDVY